MSTRNSEKVGKKTGVSANPKTAIAAACLELNRRASAIIVSHTAKVMAIVSPRPVRRQAKTLEPNSPVSGDSSTGIVGPYSRA